MNTLSLYDRDFYAWTQEQAKLIKEGSLDRLDLTHLLDEVEGMGAKEKSELKSRLARLIMHLLKWNYQPAKQSRSWKNTIYDQREELQDLLTDNPSLKSKIDEYYDKSYKKAVREAVVETGLDDSLFPKKCEWKIEQLLDDEFFPGSTF
jgi:hypothetical protein